MTTRGKRTVVRLDTANEKPAYVILIYGRFDYDEVHDIVVDNEFLGHVPCTGPEDFEGKPAMSDHPDDWGDAILATLKERGYDARKVSLNYREKGVKAYRLYMMWPEDQDEVDKNIKPYNKVLEDYKKGY